MQEARLLLPCLFSCMLKAVLIWNKYLINNKSTSIVDGKLLFVLYVIVFITKFYYSTYLQNIHTGEYVNGEYIFWHMPFHQPLDTIPVEEPMRCGLTSLTKLMGIYIYI